MRDAATAWLDSIRSTRLAIQTAWATSRGGKWTGNYDTITNARLAVETLVQEEIDERRRTGNDGCDDVLGIMLGVRDDEGDPLPDSALREQIASLLIAGYETTSQALSWLGNEITRQPELLERLTESAQGDDPEWIDATIHEVLRLHPPAMFNVRYVAERFAFDDGVRWSPAASSCRSPTPCTADRTSTPSPTDSCPSASSASDPRPMSGSRSGAALVGASARPSRCSRSG